MLFISLEYAYYSLKIDKSAVSRTDLSFGNKIFSFLQKNSKEYISAILFFGVLTVVVSGLYIKGFTFAFFILYTGSAFISFIIHLFLIILVLILIFGINHIVFMRLNKSMTSNIIAVPVAVIYLLISPLLNFFYLISSLLGKLFKSKKSFGNNTNLIFSIYDIKNLPGPAIVSNTQDAEIEHDIKIFQNALDFSELRLRDCAIPRNEIEAVELNSPVEKLREKFIETGFSKILIYQDIIDNIIGYAQSVDMFQSPKSISAIIKNLMIVPETMPANKLLNLFLKEHKSISLVVDEYGGTYGIVTIEDIIEEIIGDIEDEYDSSDLREEQISETEYLLSGRLEIDYLNEKYALGIPESDDYATIAGFILHHYEEIPKEKDKVKIDRFEFEIVEIHSPKIELVRLKIS